MDRKHNKKGFTLIEMVIAMVVIVIVFGMVTMMSVSISGYSQEKTLITECHDENARAQQFIGNWVRSLDDAFNTNFDVMSSKQIRVKSGLYWFEDPNNHFDLYFRSESKTLVGEFYTNGKLVERQQTFKWLNNVTFTQGSTANGLGNTFKCVLEFEDGSKYTMLMEKESSKQGLSVIFSQPFEKKQSNENEFIFITSADWDGSLQQTSYDDLQNVAQLAAYDFSAAYQYATLSMLRVQVDHQNRMSLEAFTSTYGANWKVRIFSASGKVAYGMKLPEANFQAVGHRLSFFIEEGSVLYDGTPVEPLGFTRKPGNIGTTDWHTAAELTYIGDRVDGGIWWLDFETNIFWDELNAQGYSHLQYDNIRKLYGLSSAFGAGLENGVFISLNGNRNPLGIFADNAVYVFMDNTGTNNTIRIHIGLNAGELRPGSGFEGEEVIVTFTNRFSLPDGTPLREDNIFRCKIADYGVADFKEAVPVSAGGEFFSDSTGVASGDPLKAWSKFNMDFYIHAPWTSPSHQLYLDLQDASAAKTNYGLTDEFLNNLYDRIFIGKDGVEISLRKAITTYKLKLSLRPDSVNSDRIIFRITINTSDLASDSYPMNMAAQVFSIRFGDSKKSSSYLQQNMVFLPNDTPLHISTFARPVAEYGNGPWLARHTLSSSISSSTSDGYLKVNITSNGIWDIHASARFNNVLTNNQGFSAALINSLQNKISLKIGDTEKTLKNWGISNFDFDVYESNGRWALQMKIKNTLVSGKSLVIKFTEGFVGPDGTTLVVPINYVRDGANSWTGSTDPGLFFPNRTVSILNTTGTAPAFSVNLGAGSYTGTAPYKVYAHVKLENSSPINASKAASAKIILDYASSADVTLFTMEADTSGWISLSELCGGVVSLNKENAKITVKMENMTGKFTIADLIITDKNGVVIYSMANDTKLYGVGDVRNVNNIHSDNIWSVTNSGDASFPIITKYDSYYTPNRVLGMTVNSGYTGGDSSFFINPDSFTRGITYYVTGRIRTNVTGKTSASTAGSHSAAVMLSGFSGLTKSIEYDTKNGEWVAIANADGSPLQFRIDEVPKTLTTPTRTIGMGSHLNTQNAKMVIDCGDFNLNYTAGIYIVRGYYKVTSYEANLGATSHRYTIGGNADSGKIETTGNQTSWKYFRLVWDSRKGKNLDFEFMNANGFMYLADLTIETPAGAIVYDMSLDTGLTEGWHTGFPWDPSIWYFTRFGEHSGDAMDLSVEAVGSATPVQYTYTRTTTGKTLANGSESRIMSIHSKYGTTNGKMTIQMDQFKSKIGSGTYTIRGFYKVEGFTSLGDGAKYEIGDGASKGMESGSSNVTTWNYFELTWSPTTNLNFEFHNAMGYLRLANLTIEDAKYKVVYDMATDTALTESYRTGFPWNPSIWYITYFGQPDSVMDLSIGAVSSATPKQYSIKTDVVPIETVSSVKRSMGLASSGKTINAKMILFGSKFAAAKGAGTYTVRGYYKVTNYTALESSGHSVNIGTGASSGKVSVSKNVSEWTRFTLTWNTSSDLVFEFWKCTGGLYIGNLVIENSAGTWLYDLSTDTAVPSGYYNAFPKENGYWYWGYSTNATYPTATMNISIGDVSSGSPGWFNYKYTEVPTSTIADSAVKRKIGIHADKYLESGKMIILSSAATTKFGSNQNLIVRGYYKVTSYAGTGSDPWWQIGSNASSGASGKKTGNQGNWTYFKITWNTSKDLNFEFWHCNGLMYLANLTIENSSGTILYDMSTDTALDGTYYTSFPQQKGIWYFTNEGNINYMDSVVTKVGSTTPKQYTTTGIKETAKTLANGSDTRTIGIGAKHKLQNAKMVITAAQATAKFGANKNMIVRGYYKVTSYTKIADGGTESEPTPTPVASNPPAPRPPGNISGWNGTPARI